METHDEPEMSELEQGILAVCKVLGRDEMITTPEGYTNGIRAGIVGSNGARIAWVEDEGTGGNYTLFAKIDDGLLSLDLGVYTYNPYFGVNVELFRWIGDQLVMIYSEKHQHILLRIDEKWQPRLAKLTRNWFIQERYVLFSEWGDPDLLYCLEIPSLIAQCPIPSARESRITEHEPSHGDDLTRQLRRSINQAFAYHPHFEILAGSWLHPFWLPARTFSDYHTLYCSDLGWNGPEWFPYYYWLSSNSNDRKDLGSCLEDIITSDHQPAQPAARNAFSYMKVKAGRLKLAIATGRFPKEISCHFWREWSIEKFDSDIGLFPAEFRKAYTLLKKDRAKWLELSEKMNTDPYA
jgi:hypothetical protein